MFDVTKTDTFVCAAEMLDAAVPQHKVRMSNLANCDTPGYVRQDVPFEEASAKAAQSRSWDGCAPQVATPPRADGNNVSTDKELAALRTS